MTRLVNKGSKQNEIIYAPDEKMDNFLQDASIQDDSVVFLECNDFINKVGKRIRIIVGLFKDVEGEFKHIKNNKYIVVQIRGVVAVAITHVPAGCYVQYKHI